LFQSQLAYLGVGADNMSKAGGTEGGSASILYMLVYDIPHGRRCFQIMPHFYYFLAIFYYFLAIFNRKYDFNPKFDVSTPAGSKYFEF
jgi:hypothetical protein